MTDTPNCPPLSHAAQAVLDAALDAPGEPREALAAALRAAADQVAPEQLREPHGTGFRWGGWAGQQGARRDLLAIAAELEGTTRDPLEPNDLSHLSEEEFQALAPQGYHGL